MRTTKVKEEFEEMENLFEKRKGEGRWEKRKKILFIIVRGKEEEGVYLRRRKERKIKIKIKKRKRKAKEKELLVDFIRFFGFFIFIFFFGFYDFMIFFGF